MHLHIQSWSLVASVDLLFLVFAGIHGNCAFNFDLFRVSLGVLACKDVAIVAERRRLQIGVAGLRVLHRNGLMG